MLKFTVYGNSYRLKGFFTWIFITPYLLRNAVFNNFRKLQGCFNRRKLSCFNNICSNLT